MNKHYITDGAWALINATTGAAVYRGETLPDFRGDTDTIVGGYAPHKPSSTGRVHTAGGAEFFPSVYGLKWAKPEEMEAIRAQHRQAMHDRITMLNAIQE